MLPIETNHAQLVKALDTNNSETIATLIRDTVISVLTDNNAAVSTTAVDEYTRHLTYRLTN